MVVGLENGGGGGVGEGGKQGEKIKVLSKVDSVDLCVGKL